MSGTSPTSVVTMADAGGGGGGYYYRPPPFTAAQWQELELQAMIYKYLMAGIPIPSELIVAVRRSFDAISSRFFDSSLSYCSSYYGKKFDPEPGRCKRTDGKKWRCAKDAHPDSKYCERHMHRGKGRNNRSRKPVESSSSYSASHQQQHQKTTSLSAGAGATQNTAVSAAGYSSSSRNGIFQSSSGINGVYQNIPFFSIGSSDDVYSGKNVAKFRIDYGSSENDNRGYKYVDGARDPGDLSLEASGSIGNRVMGCSNAAAGQSSELHQMVNAYDHMEESTMSKLKQQNFYGEIEPVKHEHHLMQPFFDEWPTTKESWSNDLGENGAWKNNTTHSKTMLSMSTTPMMDYSEFSASNAHSPNDV